MNIVKRFSAAELRTKGRRLEGYAALFGAEAPIGGDLIETIAPGAFTATLATRGDILALVDHDPARVLARTRSSVTNLALSGVLWTLRPATMLRFPMGMAI